MPRRAVEYGPGLTLLKAMIETRSDAWVILDEYYEMYFARSLK